VSTDLPRHIHEYFADEDRDLYYELDEFGYVLRFIDIERSGQRVESAASRSEWHDARDRGELEAYQAMFGGVAEGNIGETLDDPEHPYDVLTGEQFDAVWTSSRAKLELRPGESPA
jgi:hypothetical protein